MKNSILSIMAIPLALFSSIDSFAQYPNACGSVNSRANSNGQPSNCAGVSTTPVASNFVGTPYAAVPITAKTADITLKYTNVAAATLEPYAITKITGYVNGVYTVFTSTAGPAGVPSVTGSNDALVKYCIYTTNLPTAGQLIFELTNPQTGIIAGTCTYDASCLSGCIPSNIVLPLYLLDFRVSQSAATIQLEWITENEVGMSHFEIERSINSYDFQNVATLPALAISGARETYSFTDSYAEKGVLYYYRLKMVNIDGSFSYSNIRTSRMAESGIRIKNGGANPFHNTVNLIIESPIQQEAILELIDSKGRVILRKKINLPAGLSHPVLSNLENIPSGTYNLKIICGKETKKLNLLK